MSEPMTQTQPSDLSALPPIPQHLGTDPSLLFDELLFVISQTIDAHPRSQQTRIGPSEIGTPCTRRLGHKLAGTPEARPSDSPWKPTVGTAIHAWLEEAFRGENGRWRRNEGQDVTRWLVEHKVRVGQIAGDDIDGNTDLYDRVTATVIDWKTCGPSRLKHYRRNGPGPQYRVQAHLYGRGWVARNAPVDRVMIVFLPRNGELRDAFHWSEPYDEQVALDALKRANDVANTVQALGSAAFALLPTDPTDCTFCPWWQPGATDLSTACPGDSTRDQHGHDAITDLIA